MFVFRGIGKGRNRLWYGYLGRLNLPAMVCLLLTVPFFLSCQSPQSPRQLTPAFYHWKSVYKPNQDEKQVLRQAAVHRLYIRFFDVDWDDKIRQPVPKAVVRFAEKPTELSVVPVVFITNRTLLALPAAAVPSLAQHVVAKIQQIARQNQVPLREIQLDCDWSPRSRDRYFTLLKQIRQRTHLPVSATIRLHQIKYADRTGVPPVDRGMLMVYNMADWKDVTTQNSILDLTIASRYVGFIDNYPLPLDAVLPLFRWTLVYRNGRFLIILNEIGSKQLTQAAFLRRQAEPSRFVAVRDTTAFGLSVRRGDLFRAEECSESALTQAKQQVLSHIRNRTVTLSLYHLDSAVLATYNHAYLQTLFQPIP